MMRSHRMILTVGSVFCSILFAAVLAPSSILHSALSKIDSISNQERLLKAADYIKNRYDERVGLVTESEDAGIQFFGTIPHSRAFWIYSDNLWASKALEPYYGEIASSISKTLESYLGIVGSSNFFEVVLGTTVEMPFHANANVSVQNLTMNGLDYAIMADRHQPEDGGHFYDENQYADLSLYASLNYYLKHEIVASERWFRVAESMWRGYGFEDKAVSTSYQNYKLGLYLFTAKVTGFWSNILSEVENAVWSRQKVNGGIATGTYLDGTTNSTANVETTSILLLAYNEPLIGCFSQLKIGAYYYIWWDLQDFDTNFTDHWNDSKGTPLLGNYNSRNPAVADVHILLAKQHKIDFFAVSWLGIFDWFDHKAIDQNLREGLLNAEHIDNFNFCLLYESEIILKSIYDKCSKTTDLDPAELFQSVFMEDIAYANTTYFTHSSYLRIDGKPVLFIYNLPYIYENLTSNLKNSARTIHELLDNMTQIFADNIYLVGEVGGDPEPANLQTNLTYSMDSVTNYLFSGARDGWKNVLGNATKYYPQWRSGLDGGSIKFIPSAYPGYNNTGNEGTDIVTVLDRDEVWFEEFLSLARANVDPELNMLMITSWNEWMEATMVETSLESADSFVLVVYDVVPEYSLSVAFALFISVTIICVTHRRTVPKKVRAD